jgi:hypothetical protein
MDFDTRDFVPSLRLAWQTALAIPATIIMAWLATAAVGIATDVLIEQSPRASGPLMIGYGIGLSAIQLWVTRAALAANGFRTREGWRVLGIYVQGILIGLGVLVGLILFILPGLYVFARWYLAAPILLFHGGGKREAMRRSWDLLERRWPAALAIGLIMFAVSIAPVALGLFWTPAVTANYWAVSITTNFIGAIGTVASYIAAVTLLLTIERPVAGYQEIFS